MGEGADQHEVPNDQVIVLFGASGDLAKRKLLPGMFHLMRVGLMPQRFRIIGAARKPLGDEEFRELARDSVSGSSREAGEAEAWERFAGSLRFAGVGEGFGELDRAIAAARGELGEGAEVLFYLSLPPQAAAGTVEQIGKLGLGRGARVIIEKPFGTDLDSARKLNRRLHSVFAEECIFRIDHYLGREAVQNLLALRFANGMFEPVWNRNHIDHVQIDIPETLSIEMRGCFYEETGAFRDMIVTHLFQVLGFVAMEPPTSLEPKQLGIEREKVFDAMPPLRPEDVVRGQYAGYGDEDGVELGFRYRDLRRRQGLRRQLALGGGAVLPAIGQAPGREPAPADDRLRAAAAADVPARLRPDRRVLRPRPPHLRARRPRQHLRLLPRQGARAADPARRGPHALQLRRHLRWHRAPPSTPTSG